MVPVSQAGPRQGGGGRRAVFRDSNNNNLTQLLCHEEEGGWRNVDVEPLAEPSSNYHVATPGTTSSRSRSRPPLVFLSCTKQDGTKEALARPTHWFLTNILGVEAFLDEQEEDHRGRDLHQLLAQNAHACTHAICFLSRAYRQREWCVRELNTFTTRLLLADDTAGEDADGALRLLPVVWGLANANEYSAVIRESTWIHNVHLSGNSAVDFLTRELWPKLIREFHSNGTGLCRQSMLPPIRLLLLPDYWRRRSNSTTTLAMEQVLVCYVKQNRGLGYPIPPYFASYYELEKRVTKRQQRLTLIVVAILAVWALLHHYVHPLQGRSIAVGTNQTLDDSLAGGNSETSGETAVTPTIEGSGGHANSSSDDATALAPPDTSRCGQQLDQAGFPFGVYSGTLYNDNADLEVQIVFNDSGIFESYDHGCNSMQGLNPSVDGHGTLRWTVQNFFLVCDIPIHDEYRCLRRKWSRSTEFWFIRGSPRCIGDGTLLEYQCRS